MPQANPGFFAKTPSDVNREVSDRRTKKAMDWGRVPAGAGPTVAASMAGQMLGDALTPGGNPEMERVNKIQQAKQIVESTGASLAKDPDEFYETTMETFQKLGLADEAQQVHQTRIAESQKNAADKLAQDKLEFEKDELEYKRDDARRKNPNPNLKVATDAQSITDSLLKAQVPVANIASILESSKTGDKENNEVLDEIIGGLPESIAVYNAGIGEADIAQKKAAVSELVATGTPIKKATQIVFGRSNLTLGDETPGGLDKVSRRTLSASIQSASRLSRKLQNILPQINEQTVGWLAGVSSVVGGYANQIPGLSTLVNLFDNPIDLESTTAAQEARAQFREVIGPLAKYILSQEGRVSVQAIKFANKAVTVLDGNVDAPQAITVIKGILRGAQEAIAIESRILENDGIFKKRPSGKETAPTAKIIKSEDGTEAIHLDSDGNELRRTPLR